MDDQNLRNALISEDAIPPASAMETMRILLDRDRRRIRNLARATALLWLLGALGLITTIGGYTIVVVPKLRHILIIDPGLRQEEASQRADLLAMYSLIDTLALGMFIGSMVFMVAAALFTVRLITTSRRATLRHINLSLAEISDDLKKLRPPPPTGAGP
jgi:hypothetical protein